MAIFNIYVKLPEGSLYHSFVHPKKTSFSNFVGHQLLNSLTANSSGHGSGLKTLLKGQGQKDVPGSDGALCIDIIQYGI